MALKPCKECKQEVSTSAKTCPHCGVKNPTVTAKQQFVMVLGLLIAAVVTPTLLFGGGGDQTTPAVPAKSDAECLKDLACYAEKGIVAAGVYCKDDVERLAKHSVKWVDGTFEQKFSHYRWADQSAGIVTFIGDKAEFQNGFGAYTRVIYECDLNVATNKVIDVRAQEGRLPR